MYVCFFPVAGEMRQKCWDAMIKGHQLFLLADEQLHYLLWGTICSNLISDWQKNKSINKLENSFPSIPQSSSAEILLF